MKTDRFINTSMIQTSSQFKKTNTGTVAKQATVKAPLVNDEDRTVTFTVSSGNPDRDNDVVVQKGIDTTSYMTDPVLLWGHQQSELPLGICTDIGLKDGNLTATFKFQPEDMAGDHGDKVNNVYRMCKEGFLFATSISFLPKEWERSADREGGYDFLEVEIIEISVCSVPANADATIVADPVADLPESSSTTNSDANINTESDNAKARRKRFIEYLSRQR